MFYTSLAQHNRNSTSELQFSVPLVFWRLVLQFPEATLPTWHVLLITGCPGLGRAAVFSANLTTAFPLQSYSFLQAQQPQLSSEVCPEAIPVLVTLLTRQISPFNKAQVCVMLEQANQQPIYISKVLTGVWLASQKCVSQTAAFKRQVS